MDPSGYGQTPPPTPPPDWSAPGQPGQPPSPYGQPPSPYGQPAGMWAAPPPVKRSPLPRIIGVLVTLAVIAGVAFYFVSNAKVPDAGKVVFSSDKPVAGQSTGCKVDHQLTTVAAGTPVYATYIFTSKQGSDPVSLTITKDGSPFLPATAMDATDTNGYDCFADTSDLSQIPFDAGSYQFTLTSGGNTISQGTLTVTP